MKTASYIDIGLLNTKIVNFNVQAEPNKVPEYPYNLVDAANDIAIKVSELAKDIGPDIIVIENTVKGRNRHTQRILEFIHFCVLTILRGKWEIVYMDPSQWRKNIALRLSNDDKENNKEVSKGLKRGKITKKHLSVRHVNDNYKLKLKLKDNDIADSICLVEGYINQVKGV